MAYPAYPTVPHPCGAAVWPPIDAGNPVPLDAPGMFIQDGTNGTFDMCRGKDNDFDGDFIAVGMGTRNSGMGSAKFLLPLDTEVNAAWLLINTYVADSVPDPAVTTEFSITNGIGAPTLLTEGFKYWCGSTCWTNPPTAPPSFPVTTYLRNRIYIYDVKTLVAAGSANFTVSGLPLTPPPMAISTDGDRLPGCASSQGAVLFVIYKYKEYDGMRDFRCIRTYAGARLMSSGGPWGGVPSQLLPFNQTFGLFTFSGNAKVTLAAGDTQTSIAGDRANVNTTNFLPPSNAFRKLGPSISVVTQKMSNIYAGINQLTVETSNDCVAWFLSAISADTTLPKADFKPCDCRANTLQLGIDNINPEMLINGNNAIPLNEVGCKSSAGFFPAAPYYIRIDKEIMLVTKKKNYVDLPIIVGGNVEPRHWFVQRGAGGTTPAAHAVGACVKQVMPVEGRSTMQAALAESSRPGWRPEPGRVNQRNRIQALQ